MRKVTSWNRPFSLFSGLIFQNKSLLVWRPAADDVVAGLLFCSWSGCTALTYGNMTWVVRVSAPGPLARSPSSPTSSYCCSLLCNFSLGVSSQTPTTFYRNDWPFTWMLTQQFAVRGFGFRVTRKKMAIVSTVGKVAITSFFRKLNSRPTLWVERALARGKCPPTPTPSASSRQIMRYRCLRLAICHPD